MVLGIGYQDRTMFTVEYKKTPGGRGRCAAFVDYSINIIDRTTTSAADKWYVDCRADPSNQVYVIPVHHSIVFLVVVKDLSSPHLLHGSGIFNGFDSEVLPLGMNVYMIFAPKVFLY